MEAQPHLGNHPSHPLAIKNQVIHCLLENPQVGLAFEDCTNRRLVQHPVSLGAGSPYSRALAGIEYPELDPSAVCSLSHRATQCINFLHQVTFADTANGRVAGHLPQGFNIMGQQQGFTAHARRRQTGFSAGMATAYHDYVELVGVLHILDLVAGTALYGKLTKI